MSFGLGRKRESEQYYEQAWREAIVEDEVRIATLERRVNALAGKVKELEERIKALEVRA